jgi:hypothetical protein
MAKNMHRGGWKLAPQPFLTIYRGGEVELFRGNQGKKKKKRHWFDIIRGTKDKNEKMEDVK